MIKTVPAQVVYADIWRYFVLYKHGGIYMDLDVKLKIPFSKWPQYPWDEYSLIVAPEKYGEQSRLMCNWAIMAAPKHPFMLKLIYTMLEIWV